MSTALVHLDADGQLDLAGHCAPFGPGDLVEFFLAGDQLVLKRTVTSTPSHDDCLADPTGAGSTSPRR